MTKPVKAHTRKLANGKTVKVKAHVRGAKSATKKVGKKPIKIVKKSVKPAKNIKGMKKHNMQKLEQHLRDSHKEHKLISKTHKSATKRKGALHKMKTIASNFKRIFQRSIHRHVK